jgi:hydrogenase maturation factor
MDSFASRCEHRDGCITCGDEANEMTVLRLDVERTLALCAAEDGSESSVETALVLPVDVGDTLLVHAGTAIARLGTKSAADLNPAGA